MQNLSADFIVSIIHGNSLQLQIKTNRAFHTELKGIGNFIILCQNMGTCTIMVFVPHKYPTIVQISQLIPATQTTGISSSGSRHVFLAILSGRRLYKFIHNNIDYTLLNIIHLLSIILSENITIISQKVSLFY